MPIFEVENLSLYYLTRFGEKFHAVTNVSLTMEEGEILGIAGESGCGKTTLVNGCMGLFIPPLYPESGKVRIGEQSLMNRDPKDVRRNVLSKEVSMIPQGAFNSLNPTRKIKDLARDVFTIHRIEGTKEELYQRVFDRFELLGMETEKVLNSFPIQLTAGEKQRSVIGISTLLNPKLVIADEPTSALDVSTQKEVIGVIFDLLAKKVFSTMIFITHELPLLRHVADKIAVMYAGEIVELGTSEQVVFDPVHPYTKALMGAMLSEEGTARDAKEKKSEEDVTQGGLFSEFVLGEKIEKKDVETEIRIIKGRQVRCNCGK